MIEINHLDVIFGHQPERALSLLDQGLTREQILDQTGLVVGVKNANLQVKKGEICVLMGLSGSGKSSLLRCINGLNPVTRGDVKVELNGQMVNFPAADAQTQRQLRMKTIAMVFQKFALMPWLTVFDNVAMPLELQGLKPQVIQQKVNEQLELVGLLEWADHLPKQLSGGMQQRVGLARALCTESDILLMDEPFSALDPLIRNQLQDELLLLQERLHKTIIFVSHDLDEALKIGNHIAIMKDGEIVQHDTPQNIVLAPANTYVEAFVAHINPMNVLQAESLMRPFSVPPSLDTHVQRWQEGDAMAALAINTATAVSGHTSMRDVIAIRNQTHADIWVEHAGQWCGYIDEAALFKPLMGAHYNAEC